jgi:hypothetical protein
MDFRLLGDAVTLRELSTEACLTFHPLEVSELAFAFDMFPFVVGVALA